MIDAGLTAAAQTARLEAAKTSVRALHHIALSHGHLDHTRSAGIFSKRNEHLTVHCAERVMKNKALARARRLSTLTIGREQSLGDRTGNDQLSLLAVKIPHDADPTVAFRIEYEGRRLVILTDMGHPAREATRELIDPHVLLLEFNHDEGMIETGPYPPSLRKRILGGGGHLSNSQAAEVLGHLAGSNLHTLVLAHLSEHNNTPELAREVAESKLSTLGLSHVRVLIASQTDIGENLSV
ncbi:MAG: phosphoribosyl 1,2-cyclic phosphodiesterase [Planctomycetota bacterium]|jgi:phosphoribosyl 1,2-cyclic phosphodiesterase